MLGLGLSISKINSLVGEALNALLAAVKARSANYENQAGTTTIIDELSADGLLDSASILVTPTAYSDGRLHSLKTYTGTDIFDINDSTVQSGNWVINTGSNTFTKAASGSSAGYVRLRQPSHSGMEIGGTYLVTITASGLGSGVNRLLFYNNNGTVGDEVTADGAHSQVVDVTGSGGIRLNVGSNTQDITISLVSIVDVSSDFDATSDTDATRVNSNGIIEDIAANQPRINYTPSASGAVANSGHILLEPTSTNWSYRISTNPSTWHSNNNVSITTGKADPMGGTDAAEVTVTSVSGATYTRNLFQGNSSMHTQFTVSYFLKYVDHQWMMLRPIFWSGGEENKTWFDIENGVIGTNNNDNATIEAYPNGWYRCSITFTIDPSTDASGYVHVQAMDGDGSNTQTNSVKYQACFSQGEDKDFLTSYIPVASDTSPVTRTQGTLTDSGNATLIDSTEGTLYVEIATLSEEDKAVGSQIAISDGTTDKRILIFSSAASGTEGDIKVAIVKSSTESEERIALDNSSATDLASFNKIAIGYKSGENVLFVNGSKITGANTDFETFAFNFSSALNNLEFSDGSGSNSFRGKCKALAVYKTKLSDSDMTALTN